MTGIPDMLPPLVQIFDQAETTFSDEDRARRWMTQSHRLLNDESPIEHMDTTAGADRVRYVLHQVEHFYAAMTIWRLMREKYARVAYDGGGGLVSSGRWHHAGHRVAYASEHAALAVLEN